MTAVPADLSLQHPTADPELFVTLTGGRLHIPGCPHVNSSLTPATAAQRLEMPVCDWCRKELAGIGRTYFATLAEGLRAHRIHVGTERRIREALRFVAHDQVWRPHSGSYVALGLDGRGVAWVGKGYVFVKATGAFVELPGYRASRGGGSLAERPVGEICGCGVARSLTGECDRCE